MRVDDEESWQVLQHLARETGSSGISKFVKYFLEGQALLSLQVQDGKSSEAESKTSKLERKLIPLIKPRSSEQFQQLPRRQQELLRERFAAASTELMELAESMGAGFKASDQKPLALAIKILHKGRSRAEGKATKELITPENVPEGECGAISVLIVIVCDCCKIVRRQCFIAAQCTSRDLMVEVLTPFLRSLSMPCTNKDFAMQHYLKSY